MPDAVVIGAGPNGLVAANVLADAGMSVAVLEAQSEPGGAVRTRELTVPGFHHDLCSAFYPLAAVSPVLTSLALEDHGLRWRRAPLVLAHAFRDGSAAALSTDPDETAMSVERFGTGDGVAWRELHSWWREFGDDLVTAMLSPVPPVGPTTRLLRDLRRPRAVTELARTALLPVRRFTEERFRGEGAAMLVAGNTLHTDLSPDDALGALYGLLLCMVGQDAGFPVPEGGAARLIDALVRRLRFGGGDVVCDAEVVEVVVREGHAVAVRCQDGTEVDARCCVLADVSAPMLYRRLLDPSHVPGWAFERLEHFELDHATIKIDWALSGPVPWKADDARRAGTVHLGDDMAHLLHFARQLRDGVVPEDPFVLCGQMNVADPSRSPSGTETLWAYTHVPQRAAGAPHWTQEEGATVAERIENMIEDRAPGFRDLVLGRHVITPDDFQSLDANLIGGALNGGTSQLHQQLPLRPFPGRAGPHTGVGSLYLASAAAHPGGGVHGACGANAARAALRAQRWRRVRGRLTPGGRALSPPVSSDR